MEPEGLAMAHALLDLFNPFQKNVNHAKVP